MKLVLSLLSMVTVVLSQSSEEPVAIVKYDNEGVNADGSYKWSYETGNGINAEEQGQLKDAGNAETEALQVIGSYQYTAPDGTPISVSYVANEDGFVPQGDHIPTPPPVPAAIQRSLEWNAAHPEPEEKQSGAATNVNPVYQAINSGKKS